MVVGVIIKVSAVEGVNSDWGASWRPPWRRRHLCLILKKEDHEADKQRVGRKQSPRQREEGSKVPAPEGSCLVASMCENLERPAGGPL